MDDAAGLGENGVQSVDGCSHASPPGVGPLRRVRIRRLLVSSAMPVSASSPTGRIQISPDA
ncbi:hypothetical protein ACFYXW_26740 [Streptomyces sp. NPDC001981]|uniref:hypothetical protein n=1 Tax=Streptomyces sp. NPDC001981 TaxID=3364628 RepID=UPI00367A0117